MDAILIKGGPELRGEVQINGAKNAALPLIASAALTGEKKLETNLILLNRLIRQTTGTADLARAYYGTFQAAQAFMRKAGATASG